MRVLMAGAIVLALACAGAREPLPDAGGGGGGGGAGGGDETPALDAGAPGADGGGEPTCALPTDPFDPAAMRGTIAFLASDALAGREVGEPGDLLARVFLSAAFRCMGLSPAGDGGGYQQAFVNDDGDGTANVVALLPGGDPNVGEEIIVVGAHHDHLGVIDGEIYPGANDNASGVAGVLAVAQALAARDAPPRRTIAFILFGSEETDLEGSAWFVAHAPPALPVERVVYMINLDMIGTYDDREVVWALGSLDGTPARDVLETLAPSHAGLTIGLGQPSDAGDSDFYAFCQAGIPYLYFFTDDLACYHEPCDTVDRIAAAPLAEIARLTSELTIALADGDANLTAGVVEIPCGD